MATSTIEISTDGSLVQVAMVECHKSTMTAYATAITPDDAEALGHRLIECSRIARLIGSFAIGSSKGSRG